MKTRLSKPLALATAIAGIVLLPACSSDVETADADFNVLGVQMRGYHDFGVALQDPRGGLRAKGEA